jgi:ketosteroid isomerase-like protein
VIPEEPPTPDLVELTRVIFDAVERKDWDAVISFHSPDSVWDASRFDVGIFEGKEAIRGLFEGWLDAYEDWHVEQEEVVALGNGVVFVLGRQTARLRGSDAYLQGKEALIFEWIAGMIVRVAAYSDIDEARAAAERLVEARG